jgi:hypothetical protein
MAFGSISADKITNSDGFTLGGSGAAMKNRIINGSMVIDQRNAGASITPTNGQFSLDRFQQLLSQSSKYTAQQSTTAPAGFTNSLLITSSSAYSVISSDFFAVRQIIEGYNVADLNWGTANAKTVTLSFWVRSSLTGTFGGALTNDDNTRSYPYTYTISVADTWEYKSVTIAGDTTGTWLKNNGRGIQVRFGFGVGSTQSGTAGAWANGDFISATGATSVVGTDGATFYITGVQLEVGSTATSFDYRPYGTELALCQRYYFQSWGNGSFTNNGNGYAGHVLPSPNNSSSVGASSFPVTMRATPTVTSFDSLGESGKASQPAIANGITVTTGQISTSGFFNVTHGSSTFTVGTPVTCQFTASIEL